MSKKTALMELIEWMKKEISFSESMVKQKATELLEKEKSIIVDAFDAARDYVTDLGEPPMSSMKYRNANSYYQTTFIQ